MGIALFYFTINYIAVETGVRLPSWYCFKCFTFWGVGILMLLSGNNIFLSIGSAGLLSFLTTLYDRDF